MNRMGDPVPHSPPPAKRLPSFGILIVISEYVILMGLFLPESSMSHYIPEYYINLI